MQFLDILPVPSKSETGHYIINEDGDIMAVRGDGKELREETPDQNEEAPLLNAEKSELSSTAVAGLAVALLLGAALLIMSTLSAKH